MDDELNKDDGLRLIIEPGYSIASLQNYIAGTCMAKRCEFLNTLEPQIEVEQICKEFLKLLEEELSLDEITTLFVGSSMIYFIQATPQNLEWREHLLQNTFRYVDTLKPMHLHLATKRLWEGLRMDGINFVFNILSLSNEIAIASDTGNAIAISLMWTIVSEITEAEIDLYCFREFSELHEMLTDIDGEMLQMEDTTNIVYILVRSIGFLINSIVFGNNDNFKKAGYREYFNYKRRDLEKLKAWGEQFCDTLKVSVSSAYNFWDLRMAIKEYVNSNIIAILQDKITDMKRPLEDP